MEQNGTTTQAENQSTEINTVEDLKKSLETSTSNDTKAAVAAVTETQAETPAYVPVGKFKYTGKVGEKWTDAEGEFDEVVKAAIKTKEDEEKWQKLYAKAHGLDFVQHGRESARNELNQYKTQWQPIVDMALKANKAFVSDDIETLLETIGVPYEKIQKLVFSKLQQQDLPESQRQILEQNRMLAREKAQYGEQLSSLEQKNLQIQSEMLHNELSQEMSKPDVSSFQQAFDAKNGQGAFEQEVRARGNFIYHSQQGRVARPGEVIQDIISKFGFGFQPAINQSPTQSATQPQAQSAQKPKPTIPVASGSGGSPTYQSFKSTSDLEKRLAELSGN